MSAKEKFLSNKKRYQPITLPEEFSDEEMVRDWTLSAGDLKEIIQRRKYRKEYRLFIAIQLCAVRLYGRFLTTINDLSPRILSYLNNQLNLPPSLTVRIPERRATVADYQKQILTHLGFQRFNEPAQQQLQSWLEEEAKQGVLPNDLYQQAEGYLLSHRILMPGASVLERLIIHICSNVHEQLFESIYQRLSPDLRKAIDQLLTVSEGERRSLFSQLKAYPPEAKISSLRAYLQRYQALMATGIDDIALQLTEPAFQDYLFRLTKKYSAKEMKRFHKHKQYAMMICFLLETRKNLLDYLVEMHDQYMTKIVRESRNIYEKKHRALRKRQKRAVDIVLKTTDMLLAWPEEEPLLKSNIWQQVNETDLRDSLDTLRTFKTLEERGYGDILINRYPSLRKYFADFLHLPFAVEHGSAQLLRSIQIVRQLDANKLKKLPHDTPIALGVFHLL